MIKVLHYKEQFLPKSEIWLKHLIDNLESTHSILAAKTYSNLHELSLSKTSRFKHKYEYWFKSVDELNFNNPSHFLRKAFLVSQHKKYFFWKNLEQYIQFENVTILHAHFAYNGFPLLSISKKFNIPLVVSLYGWDYNKFLFLNPNWKKKYIKIFTSAHAFIVEGQTGKENLVSKGIDIKKIFVIPLGKKFTSSQPKRVSIRNNKNFELIQVCRIERKKGIIDVLRALARLQNLPIKFTLVGSISDPKYFEEILTYVKTNKLDSIFTYKSFVPYNQLSKVMSKFDLFIHPSKFTDKRDSEGGIPTIMFDALACGLPIISTKHCDIPEAVINDYTGFLVEESNINQLSQAIEKSFRLNKSDYNIMANQAINHVFQNFNISTNAKMLEEVYENISK